MIEELLYWPVRSKSLIRLGKRIEEINKEFRKLDLSLQNGCEGGLVNMNRARSLPRKIEYLRGEAARINIKGRNRQAAFERLVLEEFEKSLFTQQEYIQFFFTMKYNKEWGVKDFFNYAFLPRAQFEGKTEENSAVAFLENNLRNINYRAKTKRENLMEDITTRSVSVNPSELEAMLIEQIPKMRKIIGDYNVNMGFETREQVEAQNLVVQQKETEKIQEKIKSLFGEYKGDIPEIIMAGVKRQLSGLRKKSTPLDEAMRDLIYELVLNYEDSSAWDSATRTMEINADRFYFYKDKKTDKKRLYAGDIIRSIGHENFHRMQSYFSRLMPVGIRETDGEYNLTGRTISEGVATVLEDNFMNWFENNRKHYFLSQRDIEIAKLMNVEHFGNRIVRLVHSIYHREETPLEKNEDKDAHLRLAKVSKVPVYADDDYLHTESMPETYDFAFYFFGQKYVKETLKELEQIEKKRLDSLRKARNFLKRNEPIVIQGLLTGNWGWSTHKDFFLKHYWKRARKYCV